MTGTAIIKVENDKRIDTLKDEIKRRDRRIEELRSEIDEQRDLIERLRENVDDFANCLESWKEAFEMELNEKGEWTWQPFQMESLECRFTVEAQRKEHNALVAKHNELTRKWNAKLLGGQPVGRPLNASETQIKTVLEMRERGTSLRTIAEETGLSLNTVRTVVDKKRDAGRAARRHKMLLPRARASNTSAIGWEPEEFEIARTPEDRQKAIKFKRQKRTIDALPKRAQTVVEKSRALITEANGLGKR